MFRVHFDTNVCIKDIKLELFKHNDSETTVLYGESQSIDESQNDLPTLVYNDSLLKCYFLMIIWLKV